MERQRQYLANLGKKFVIKNVYSLIALTLQWGKHVMFMPYESTKDRTFIVSRKLYVVYTTILILSNTVITMRSIMKLGPEDRRNPYILLGYSRLISQVSYLFLMTIIVARKAADWALLLNEVVEFDDLLPLSRKLRTKLIATVMIQLAYFIVRSVSYIYFTFIAQEEWDIVHSLETLNIFLLMLYVEWVYINVISNLAWMKVTLDRIHQELNEKLVQDKLPGAYKSLWENAPTIYTVVGWQGKAETDNVERIRRLRSLYGKFMNIKEKINNHYSSQILLTITSIFFDMVFFVFLLVTLFQFWEAIGTNARLVNKFRQVMIITTSQITKLFLTVVLCQSIKSKGGKAAFMIHKSLQKATNPESKNELFIFSVELLHYSTEINAGGFFAVDFELLHTIIAAVTVYTIMIVQFQFAPTVEGENPVESLCKFV